MHYTAEFDLLTTIKSAHLAFIFGLSVACSACFHLDILLASQRDVFIASFDQLLYLCIAPPVCVPPSWRFSLLLTLHRSVPATFVNDINA